MAVYNSLLVVSEPSASPIRKHNAELIKQIEGRETAGLYDKQNKEIGIRDEINLIKGLHPQILFFVHLINRVDGLEGNQGDD